VGIQCLDQNWSTFDTPAGRRILENALVKVVMRVDETAAPAIVENLGLTGHHAEVILSAGVGEGILIVESKPYHVYFQASRSEVEMLTPYTQRSSALTVESTTRR
jgi:NADPH-dependent ferric siderophore reductase